MSLLQAFHTEHAYLRTVHQSRWWSESGLAYIQSQYIADIKIEMGKNLLKEGMSVGAVAQHLGYSSSQSFCKAFDRREGCSPTMYLKNQRKV